MSNLDTEVTSTAKVKQSHHPWEHRIKDKYYCKYKYSHNSVNNPIYPPRKEDYKIKETCQERRVKFTVIGNRVTKEFIYCIYLVKGLFKYRQKHFEAPIITGVTGVEWPKVWNDLKIRFGDLVYCLKSQVAVFKNDQFLGGEDELTQFVETKYVYRLYLDYHKEGQQQFANYIKASGKPCAYLHISINKEPIGSLIFMLYADAAPLTCQNFLQLCEKVKGGYGGTPIHRIVKDCWIQCGGYGLKSTNLVCENFIVPHDRRGVLCMANDGRNVDCSTQFFVLLQPASWMEHKYVAFGQLIEGEKTLSQIENVPTWYESPTSDIIIEKAGILNLDCQKVAVNKNIDAYIQGHIENLASIGQSFYEVLLNKVFEEIEIRIAKRHQNIEEFLYHKYSITAAGSDTLTTEGQSTRHETIASGEITEDDDLHAKEEISESSRSLGIKPPTAESSSIIPEQPVKPFYLPLADVPYPDDVDSVYNLEKFMRGDYCLESDLEKLPRQTKLYGSGTKSVPAELIGQLFDYLINDTKFSPDLKADLDFHKKVGEIYRDDLDKVSLAGRVVKKMATLDQLSQKDLLEGKKDEVISDDTLRKIRVARKQSKKICKPIVSIKVPSAQPSMHKICRRQTGMFPPRDIKYLAEAQNEDDTEDEESESLEVEQEQGTSLQQPPINEFTSSVLHEMFHDVALDYEHEFSNSTFQSYTPPELLPPSILTKKGNTKRKFQLKSTHLTSRANLLDNKRISNELSTDPFTTKNKLEFGVRETMRSLKHAKRRPSLTISEYQMKNRKYREDLKLQKW